MAKIHMTMAEIYEAIREHGVKDISLVDLCVLEVDGNIPALFHDYQEVTQRKRKTQKTPKHNFD